MKRWLLIACLLLGSILCWGKPSRQPLPSEGEPHIFTVLVEFRNVRFTLEDPQSQFFALLNGQVGSYFREQSNGRYRPVFDVYGPVLLDKPMATYGKDRMENGERLGDMAPEKALYEACQQLDASIDFTTYDADKDGILDLALFIYAGYDQAGGAGADAIWSHHADIQDGADPPLVQARLDDVELGYYFCTSELRGTDGAEPSGIGKMVHEMGHALGLPDLYDTDGAKNGLAGGMYQFSVMAQGLYNKAGDEPPPFLALEKTLLGWMAPEDFVPWPEQGWMHLSPGEAALSATSREGECFYYECLPIGLLVYHVDRSSRPLQGAPAISYWDDWRVSNQVNAYGAHPCCYVVPPMEPKNFNAVSLNPSALVFPGAGDVRAFVPEDWDGEAGARWLSCVEPDHAGVRFRVVERGEHILCGLVLDESGRPVAHALVQLFADEILQAADQSGMDGYFEMETEQATAARWRVRVSKSGYRTMEKETDYDRGKLVCTYLPLVKEAAPASTLFYTYNPALNNGYFAPQEKGAQMAAVRFTAEELAPYVGRRLEEVHIFPYVLDAETLGNLYVIVDVNAQRQLSQKVQALEVGEFVPILVPLDADFRIPEGLDVYVGYGFDSYGENQPLSAVYPGRYGNSYYTPFSLEKSAWKPLYQQKAGFYMDLMLQTRLEEVPAENLAQMGYACISLPEGPLRAGETIDLQLLMPEDAPVSAVSWRLDGQVLGGTQFTLTAGEHTLEAQLLYEDAREEVLRARLTVR